MPTFEELLNVNLSPLQSAGDDWAAMAVLLKKVATEAGGMRSLAQGTEWKGENATVTKPFVVRVSDEFTDAVTEAESIANLLHSAHGQIKAARDDLKNLYENPPAGITLAGGTLTRSAQPRRISHGDPVVVVVVTQDDLDALQRRIDAILGRVAEADSTCSWGLGQLTKDKHKFGSTYYDSLQDAKTDAQQAQQSKTDSVDYTTPAKWGSGTITPIAEFFSYRSWMGGVEAALHGDVNGAIQGAIVGSPSAAGGEARKASPRARSWATYTANTIDPRSSTRSARSGRKYSVCRSPWSRQGSTSTTRPTSPGPPVTPMWKRRQNRER
ncbi:hypothetical protein ACIBCO_38940 [Streptomyces violascens]|uniref:hypothetical protein n=1 Tax=Streptomyces violascens TaxID=67381 RepID=UPI0037972503